MSLRAETDNKFLYKYLLIALGTLAFSGWSFYDAMVNYPTRIPRSAAYDELLADTELNNLQRQERWEVVAAENGWPEEPPEKTVEDVHYDINWNYIFGAIAALVGVPNLVWFLRNRGTWIQMDGEQLSNSRGQKLELSQVVQLDKKKWAKKGIAVLKYKTDGGGEESFVLDDLKYERQPVDEMMAGIEEKIGTDLIVNGPTEVELAKEAELKKAERARRLAATESGD